MKTKSLGVTALGIFILITAVGFIIWISIIVLLWPILKSLNITTDLIILIEALSTALAAAAVFGAGFFAYRELSEVWNLMYSMKEIAGMSLIFINTRGNLRINAGSGAKRI